MFVLVCFLSAGSHLCFGCDSESEKGGFLTRSLQCHGRVERGPGSVSRPIFGLLPEGFSLVITRPWNQNQIHTLGILLLLGSSNTRPQGVDGECRKWGSTPRTCAGLPRQRSSRYRQRLAELTGRDRCQESRGGRRSRPQTAVFRHVGGGSLSANHATPTSGRCGVQLNMPGVTRALVERRGRHPRDPRV